MSKSFDEVMQLTREIGSEASFSDEECRAYWRILSDLQPNETIVEIGLQFGRSSSIALQVAKDRSLKYYGVDPFIDPTGALEPWVRMAMAIGTPFTISVMSSMEAHQQSTFPADISVGLIDGNHWPDAVRIDADILMPRIRMGGYLLFHDYGEAPLPNVYPTVDAAMVRSFMFNGDWRELETIDTLGIWERGR